MRHNANSDTFFDKFIHLQMYNVSERNREDLIYYINTVEINVEYVPYRDILRRAVKSYTTPTYCNSANYQFVFRKAINEIRHKHTNYDDILRNLKYKQHEQRDYIEYVLIKQLKARVDNAIIEKYRKRDRHFFVPHPFKPNTYTEKKPLFRV